jgi:hypothetical protein
VNFPKASLMILRKTRISMQWDQHTEKKTLRKMRLEPGECCFHYNYSFAFNQSGETVTEIYVPNFQIWKISSFEKRFAKRHFNQNFSFPACNLPKTSFSKLFQ